MKKCKGRALLFIMSLIPIGSLHVYLSIHDANHLFIMIMSTFSIGVSWQVGKYIDKLRYERDTDPLTKAYTRRAAQRIFRKLSKRAVSANRKLAIYFVDVDNFKTVNDNYGHHVGDTMLKKISSQLLQLKIRDKQVARWGGDEFVIMVPCANDQEAHVVQHALLSHIQLPVLDEQTPLTISVGCSTFPNQGRSLNELVDIADKQMLWNKRQGKSDVNRKRCSCEWTC